MSKEKDTSANGKALAKAATKETTKKPKATKAAAKAKATTPDKEDKAAAEPTYDELERDVKGLLHGHADGEIVIKNETHRVKSGVREVVDNVHRGKSAFIGKASLAAEEIEASVDEGTEGRKK